MHAGDAVFQLRAVAPARGARRACVRVSEANESGRREDARGYRGHVHALHRRCRARGQGGGAAPRHRAGHVRAHRDRKWGGGLGQWEWARRLGARCDRSGQSVRRRGGRGRPRAAHRAGGVGCVGAAARAARQARHALAPRAALQGGRRAIGAGVLRHGGQGGASTLKHAVLVPSGLPPLEAPSRSRMAL